MKLSKTIGVTAIVAAGAALLSTQAAVGRESGPYARSVHEVGAIWLNSNSCTDQLISELDDRGFGQTFSRRSADAALNVDVHPLDARMGASARYTATLRGDDGRILFRTSGREDSISYRELCADISDEVVDRLQDRMG